MSEALSGIFTNPAIMNSIKAGTGISGVLANILNMRKQGQVANSAIEHQKMVDALIKNPALMSQKIAALRQPLSQGLTQAVGNDVQGQLAERGLGTSPQIATAVESQALAPFEQKSQEDAIQAFLGTLGMGPSSTGAASNAIPGMSDNSGFWNMFQPKPTPSPAGGGAGSPTAPGLSTDSWSGGE